MFEWKTGLHGLSMVGYWYLLLASFPEHRLASGGFDGRHSGMSSPSPPLFGYCNLTTACSVDELNFE